MANKPEPNLNKLQPYNDGNYPEFSIEDNSLTSSSRNIRVYFRNLEPSLLEFIKEADAVMGCVAWLTSGPILDALAKKEAVSIVVQKEDFLRPDLGSSDNWKSWLMQKYLALRCNLTRYAFDNIIGRLAVLSDPSLDAIRCVGNYNRDKSPAFPRMHNKFLVFANVIVEETQDGYVYKEGEYIPKTVKPYAVWTGSFNLTKNAVSSLENALYITEPDVVNAYFKEYGQIVAISEPLKWENDWVEPEWHIGT
jgi:hypothetical protein